MQELWKKNDENLSKKTRKRAKLTARAAQLEQKIQEQLEIRKPI